MADTNIPAWLAALRAQQAQVGGSGWSPGASYTDPETGATYGQSFATSANGGGEGGGNQTSVNGYWGADAANMALDAQKQKSLMQSYDLSGNKTSDFTNDPNDGLTPQQWAMMMAAAMAGGYGLNAAFGGAGAAGGLGGGAMDTAAFEGIGGATGGAGGAAGGIGTMEALPLMAEPAWVGEALSMSPMAVGGAAAGGAAGAGLAGTMKSAGGLLGPAATILGAAAGAQGQKTSTTTDRKTDPRVDPYLFGDGAANPGLLGYTQQQLARDMSPERQAQINSIFSKGMGLLNQPVAGNGFNLLTKGRY